MKAQRMHKYHVFANCVHGMSFHFVKPKVECTHTHEAPSPPAINAASLSARVWIPKHLEHNGVHSLEQPDRVDKFSRKTKKKKTNTKNGYCAQRKRNTRYRPELARPVNLTIIQNAFHISSISLGLCTEHRIEEIHSLSTFGINENYRCEHTFCGGAVAFVIVADLSAGIIFDSVWNGRREWERRHSVKRHCNVPKINLVSLFEIFYVPQNEHTRRDQWTIKN